MLQKPFIYLSEAVVTPSRSVDLIKKTVANLNARPQVDVTSLWREAALSVRSQASLHKMPGFKGEKYQKWLNNVMDTVADGILFPSVAAKQTFKATVLPQIGKPRNYFVPQDVKDFISQLDKNKIGWGIIANESHLYPAVVKGLGLSSVGPLVLSSGLDTFKPLPRMWLRAIERAPAASKHNVWFIGSSEAPCDNMSENSRIRCALIKPDLEVSDPFSQHFRARSLDDILPLLISNSPEFGFLKNASSLIDNTIEVAEAGGDDDDDVRVSTFLPVPPLTGKEKSAAGFLEKETV